tara:strand:+ start:1772 stop:2344 length:573 start_codon:yes stop_codon:yes gene_type:complete
VFIAEGSTCRFASVDSDEAKKAIELRSKCAEKALHRLGVSSYKFYNLPCGRLDQEPQIKINKIIEKEISNFKPDVVLTHSNSDSNKDHTKVYDATIIATRPQTSVKDVYSYEVLSSSEWGFSESFSPNVFYKLSEANLIDKWESLKLYETEIQHWPYPRSKEGVYSLAKIRGSQSGVDFAEAFKLVRSFR